MSFSLGQGNKKYLLEIKKGNLIKRDLPVLNKNINSVMLHLFDTVYYCNFFNFPQG